MDIGNFSCVFTLAMPTSTKNHEATMQIGQICRYTVGGIWLYQGLVPKLLGPHADELAMAAAFGIPPNLQSAVSISAGFAEIALAVCIFMMPGKVWLQLVSAVATVGLLVFVAMFAPRYLVGAFNPVVMNISSIALSMIGIICIRSGANSKMAELP